MDMKIALLVGLVIGLIAAAFLLWPSPDLILPSVAKILVEGGITPWTDKLRSSSALMLNAAEVRPRVRISHAATSGLVSPLMPSAELVETAINVAPRIVVGHAATTSAIFIGLVAAPSAIVSPRVLVEYASTATLIGPITPSSGLQSDSAKVSTKLLIEDAELVDTLLLEARPPGSPGK